MNLLPHLATGAEEKSGSAPDQVKTMFGTMPNFGEKNVRQEFNSPEQIKSLIDTAAGGGEGLALKGAEILPKAVEKAAEVSKYLHPEKDAEALTQSLGGGASTAEENIANLAQSIKKSHDINSEEALSKKQNVLDVAGKENIYTTAKSALPEGNLDKMAKVFGGNKVELTPDKANALSKALSKYRSNSDMDSFVEKGEDIFGYPVSDSKISKIENMLSIPAKRDSGYLSNNDAYQYYDKDLKKLHDAFAKKPTFENADELQSQLGKDIGSLQRASTKGTLDTAGLNKLSSLKEARDLLNKDQKTFLKERSPELNEQYETFKKEYKQNVVPYYSEPALSKMVKREGETSGFTPGDISSIFSFPDKFAKKVASDIGQEGKNKILYNELQKVEPGDVEGLVQALKDAKKLKGYQDYIAPEMEEAAKDLEKRAKVKGRITTAGKFGTALAGGTVLGHPLMGAIAGAGWAVGKPALVKALELMGKK